MIAVLSSIAIGSHCATDGILLQHELSRLRINLAGVWLVVAEVKANAFCKQQRQHLLRAAHLSVSDLLQDSGLGVVEFHRIKR